MAPIDKIFAQALQRNHRSSALTPLLYLTAVIGLPSLYLSFQAQGPTRVAFFALTLFLVIAVLAAYGYLVRRDPRLVQSESFQIEARKLDIVESKGASPIEAFAVEVTPEPKVLPESSTAGERANG